MREIYLCELYEPSASRINLYCMNFCHTMHYNAQNARMHKFINQPDLMVSHKIVAHIKNVALQYLHVHVGTKCFSSFIASL